MHLFYTPDIAENECLLDAEQSRHCVQVLRLRAGDRVRLTDGRGGWYLAEILPGATAKVCRVGVIEKLEDYGKRDYRLHIAIAPTKNIDRYEWFLEKATEIGVDRITPLLCEHSERKNVRHDRSEKVILSAVRQSLKAYVPQLDELTPLATFLAKAVGVRFIAHCDEGTPIRERKLLFEELAQVTGPRDFTILIGPEGDFSPMEIESALKLGFIPVSLGEARLRTETAGVFAAAAVALARPIGKEGERC